MTCDKETYLRIRDVQRNYMKTRQGDAYARYYNIIYGMLRGRAYKQIEQKVREHNEPNKYRIQAMCAHENITLTPEDEAQIWPIKNIQ